MVIVAGRETYRAGVHCQNLFHCQLGFLVCQQFRFAIKSPSCLKQIIDGYRLGTAFGGLVLDPLGVTVCVVGNGPVIPFTEPV